MKQPHKLYNQFNQEQQRSLFKQKFKKGLLNMHKIFQIPFPLYSLD